MSGFSSLFSKFLGRRHSDEVGDDKEAVKNRLKKLSGRRATNQPVVPIVDEKPVSSESPARTVEAQSPLPELLQNKTGFGQSMRASLVNMPFFSLLKSEQLTVGESAPESHDALKPSASDKLASMRRLETQNRMQALSFCQDPIQEDLDEINRYRLLEEDFGQLPHIHQSSDEGDDYAEAFLLAEEESDEAFVVGGSESVHTPDSIINRDLIEVAPKATFPILEVIEQIEKPPEIKVQVEEEVIPPAVCQTPPYTLHVKDEQMGFFDAGNLLNLRINHELARNQDKARREENESGLTELRKTLASKRQKKASISQQSLPNLPHNPVIPKRRSEQETTLQLNRLEMGGETLGEAQSAEKVKREAPKNESDLPGRFDKYLLAEQIGLPPKKGKDTLPANQWDCTPDLTLTADGLLKKSTEEEGQNELGVEKPGVQEIFVDFDTTANLPDRTNPFEKFSESSLKLLAQNPRTPARILSWLASHFNHEIRVLVARNRSALPETIWLLAKDYDESVRLAIAEHLESDRAVLKSLCDDGSPLVAWRAKNTLYLLKSGARTHNNLEPLPSETLHSNKAANPFRALSDGPEDRHEEPDTTDEEMAFLKVIAQKPSTPPRRLAELAKHANKEIRAMVAENANSPLETLWFLSRDQVADVKLKLTENYNCPIEIIEALQEDKDSYVSWQARNILSKLMGEFYPGIDLPEESTNPRLLHSR